MCAIIGIASRRAITERSWLVDGRDSMRHRGPDGKGEWWDSSRRVGLAHRRLAIIDLSAGGQQPMPDTLGELRIVFNGEIYNFQDLRYELEAKGRAFATHSDTEVILAAYREWGEDCLSRLNGMFAFALYDSRSEQLLLARDRAGEKPLFYTEAEGQLRFASELKGLMMDVTLPRRIDAQAMASYLAQGFVSGEDCVLRGVRKLPPAHALAFDVKTGRSRKWRYWELPTSEFTDSPLEEERLVDELDMLLEDAVRRQLVADVPVGVLLSGGIDSSLVTAMAVRSAPRVKTFTIRFPGHGKLDETEHARLIANHFGTEHVELEAEATSVAMLPMLARQFDEPVIDSSMIPTYMVSRLVREHCTVAIGGDGGDELFGGYSHYNRLLWLEARFGRIPLGIRALLSTAAQKFIPLGVKGRNWILALDTDFQVGVPLIASYYDFGSHAQLLSKDMRGGVTGLTESTRTSGSADLMQRATRKDFENYLPEDILVKVDRASMLNSLEIRAPMLDYRVIEFAFRHVPSHLKATSRSRKVLLKKLTSRLLPPEFDQQRKQGFSIPLTSWLRSGPWLNYFREVLLDPGQTLFNHAFVRSLFDGQRRGRANGERLFGLVMFELWRREYQVQI